MTGAARLAAGGILAMSIVALACCSRGSGTTPGQASCASDADCTGGEVCGFSNAGGDRSCAARGECVMPRDRQATMLCGCGGKPIDLVVDDEDAGVYYWSGVIQGEQGFPPCGDAAIAPSSGQPDAAGADASDEFIDAAAGDVAVQ